MKLFELIEKNGYLKSDFANLIKVSYQTLWRWDNQTKIKMAYKVRIAKVLNIEVSELEKKLSE